ncbi:MAG: aminotransferase class IV [Treponemataceae bacterium]
MKNINFIESICVENGFVNNAKYHIARIEKSIGKKTWFDSENGKLFFEKIFDKLCQFPEHESKYKLRIVYNSERIIKAETVLYKMKTVKRLKIVYIPDTFDYNLKYEDRIFLDKLKEQAFPAEPLLVKNSLITDTTYTNVCFLKDGTWFTPKSFLLNGTMRQASLEKGLLKEMDLSVSDIPKYSHIALINAMLPLGMLVLPISVIE